MWRWRQVDVQATNGASATSVGRNDRGGGYLAVRRTVEASQREFDCFPEEAATVGRHGAAYLRLDRMYEVAMLVAAACEVAGVPPPEPVVTWPEELVRLRDLREHNTRQARQVLRPSD